jgi:hypothetical protein
MWTTPYAIIRPTTEGKAVIAHAAADLKRANYLLQYIAEPGDALFQTPLHPKVNGGAPKYSSHLVQRGKFSYSYEEWLKTCCGGKDVTFEAGAEATA